MKKHNASKVVLITIMAFLLLTWIFPAAYFSSEYVEQGRVQMGLFDLFNYPVTALSYFGYIAFFLVLVGGFYGILCKIPAYRAFLDKIVAKAKGKEKIVLSIFVVLIALLVSICGVQVGIALFIPFVVSIILLMGYDKIVAGLVTVGSICVGLLGTTYAGSNISILTGVFALDYDYLIWVRFIILLIGIILLLFNIFMYIKHNFEGVKIKIEKKSVNKEEIEEKVVVEKVEPVKKNTNKPSNKTTGKNTTKKSSNKKSSSSTHKSVNKAALKEEDVIIVKESIAEEDTFAPRKVEGKYKTWPIVLVFVLLFLLFTLAFIPWNQFEVSLFADITSNVQKFELFNFPLFAKLLGTFNAFGEWAITDLFLPLALSILLLAIIYKVSFEEVADGFVDGAKRALAPAVIVILLYTVLVLVTYHPFQLVIYKAILGLSKGFNIATTTFVAILCGLFNSDIAYSFQSVVPYYSSVVANVENYNLSAIIFQSMYGLTMLVAPTSLTLMAILAYLDVPYKDWMKNIWKLLLELFIVLLIVFIILALV